jgi:hypothetical protein
MLGLDDLRCGSVVDFISRVDLDGNDDLRQLGSELSELAIARKGEGAGASVDDGVGTSGELLDECKADTAGGAGH